MTLTSHRIIQYLIILLILTLGGGGYWYWKNAQAAVTQKAASKTGLVGYWSLDEGSGTSAGDASDNGNTGTLTNGPTWTSGKLGQGVTFDGVNDYAQVAHSAALNPSTITAAVWVKATRGGGSSYGADTILAKYNAGVGYKLGIESTGQATWLYFTGACTADTLSGGNIIDGMWHHVVGIRNASNLYLYIDGVQVATKATTCGPTTTTNPLYFSSWRSGGELPMQGSLDEVRIYNRAITTTEITNLYSLGAAKLNTSQNSQLTSGLVGEWSFNGPDVSGTTAYDRSGSGNNGTLTNGPTATIGKVGAAMSFDGTNDYVSYGSQLFNNLSQMTVAYWVKLDTLPAASYMPVAESYTQGIFRTLINSTGKFSFVVSTTNNAWYSAGTSAISSGTLSLGTWYHVVGTYDGQYVRTYIDGVQDGIGAQAISGNISGSGSPFRIGYQDYGSYTKGSLDEVRIYNRALSAAEIQTLYALGDADKVNSSASQPQGTGRLDSGLAGYWKLDENTGTSAADASTNGNTGTLTNGPTWTTGQIGSAVSFDGTNDYLSYASNIAFNSVDFTISTWVKANGVGTGDGTYPIFEQRVDATGNGQPAVTLGFTAAKNLSFVARDNVGAAATYTESTVRNLSQWYHVVAVKTSSAISLYVDGAFIGSTSHSLSGDFDASAVYRDFGRYRYSGIDQAFLNGVIDEPRIYNRALAADEVKQLYRTTVPTSVDTSLKGYWSFNGPDISGTTAYDRSGAGNNGTLTNSPAAAIGKVGQSLNFNGTTSFVDLLAPTALDLSGVNKFTLSAWVYPTATPNGAGVIAEMYTTTVQYTIGFSNNVAGTANSWPTVGFYNAAWRAVSEARAIDLNQWSLITGTWDGTTMNLYRNGALVATGTPGGSLPSSEFSKVVIGKRHDIGGIKNFFPGRIDEARIYNRALTATEVTALYNLGR